VKKVFLIVTLGVILLLTGGYYLYNFYFFKKLAQPWDIVPANALFVYESDECVSCREDLTQSPVWQVIDKASFQSKPVDLSQSLRTFLSSKNGLIVSLHATKKDDFDLIFFAPLNKTDSAFLQTDVNKNKYATSRRELNGIEIHEVAKSKQMFSWAVVNGVWVGSFTSFLIEDVVRTAESNSGFKKHVASTQQLPRIKGDAGNLYIQLSNFSDWLSVFSNESTSLTKSFGRSSVLDIKTEEGNVALNGLSTDSSGISKYVLSIFHNQSPVSFNLKHLISDRALSLHSFGVSEGLLFERDLASYVKSNSSSTGDSLVWLQQKAGIDLKALYQNIDDEIGVCFLESSEKRKLSKVVIIETHDPTVWLQSFEKLSQKLSIDTIFFERHADYEIREVPVFRFPEKLLWPLVSGFNQCFYTSIGKYILMAEDPDELKRFLNDIDDDNTWGKSVSYNKFLESTLLESNISIYVNTPKIWNLLSANLQPKWQQFVKENRNLLQSFQQSAIQFSHLNNSYYTNVLLQYKPVQSANRTGKRTSSKMATNFASNISGVYAVRNHINRDNELLVQDSLNDLSLVSDEGTVLWKIAIGDRIVTDIVQIDFYGNGKLQYFFATRDALHVIDRLGNYVTPYPLFVPGTNIAHASVIDYDHTKKYRFLVADIAGRMRMFDKDGENLEGWDPKDAGGALAVAPQHHRIKGKDYILAIRKDGIVHLMNRRGEDVRNFPLKLDAKVAGDYFLERGKTISDTYFTVISSDGYRIKFNVEGKIQSKETLLKTSVTTQFALVKEINEKNYLIVQRDSKQFNLLDESGRKLISNESIGPGLPVISYYDFGSGKEYVSVTDTEQGQTFVYDGTGNLLTTPPLECTFIKIGVASDDVRLFVARGNQLIIQPL
jgi:hypothetical protein